MAVQIERLLVVEQSLGNLENVAILRRSLDELKWRQWDRNGRMTRNDGCRLNRRERRSRSVGSYSKIGDELGERPSKLVTDVPAGLFLFRSESSGIRSTLN